MNHPKFKWDDDFESFLDSLSDKEAAKILSIIEKTDIHTAMRQKWVKKLESNLHEVRASISSNALRGIYFQRKGNGYFITHGFRKKANKLSR